MDLFRHMKPLLWSMCLMGFFYDFNPEDSASENTEGSERWLCFRTAKARSAHKLFCWSMCVLHWLRVLSIVQSFWVEVFYNSGFTWEKLCFIFWLLQCSLYVTIMLHGCREKGTFEEFAEAWKNVQAEKESEAAKLREKSDTEIAETNIKPADETSARLAEANTEQAATVGGGAVTQDDGSRSSEGITRGVLKVRPVESEAAAGSRNDHRVSSNDERRPEQQTHKRGGNNRERGLTPSDCPAAAANGYTEPDRPQTQGRPQQNARKENAARSSSDIEGARPTIAATKKRRRWPAFSCETKYQKIGLIFAAFAWSVALLNGVFGGLLLFADSFTPVDTWKAVVATPLGTSLPAKLASLVIFVLSSCAWVLPSCFCGGLFVSVGKRFEELTRSIASELEKNRKDRVPSLVGSWRLEHLRLCRCVTVLDRAMSKILMASYATSVPIAVYTLYRVVALELRTPNLVTLAMAFWFVSTAGICLLLSLSAAYVHDMVHEPLDLLFWIPVDNATPQSLAQVQLFIARLTGCPIGFTALGIVTVTKETLLTLAGLLATYFLVVLQF